jgi:hypothetical protein
MANLHRSNFHFSAGTELAAGSSALWAFGKHIIGLKLLLAIAAPKARGYRVNYQLSAFSESTWGKRVEGKTKSFRHYSAKSADPQAY